MIIKIDGQDYIVPAEEEILLLKQVQTVMLAEYEKLDPSLRFAAKPLARGYLQKLENETRIKHGKEKALLFRPEKKADAVVHLSHIMITILREALQHVEIKVGTLDHTIAAFSLSFSRESGGGGQVALDGDQRERQDNGTEIS